MAFGSGGTITALAETDTRAGGDGKAGSLTVLRRQRLKALLDLLMSRTTAERADMISGDPKRADIIVAGGLVLHEIMSEIGLDYIFVSARGLRDGLMVDLLQRQYANSGAWHPDADRSESLEQFCQKYSNDAAHSEHVSQLALSLFYQLQKMHKLPEKYTSIFHAAAMLHDIGLFIAGPKHHKHSYYLIKSSGMKSFNKLDLELVANIARYHRKAHPSQKHLGFSQLSPANQDVVRKLSSCCASPTLWIFAGNSASSRSVAQLIRSVSPSPSPQRTTSKMKSNGRQKRASLYKKSSTPSSSSKRKSKPKSILNGSDPMRRGHIDRNILFLCEDNACLSQMAEATAKHLAPPRTRIFSAGVKPSSIPPRVVQAMQELGISMSGQTSKGLAEVPIQDIDLVVSFGDAHKKCVNLPGRVKVENWPVRAANSTERVDSAPISELREERDEIDKRVFALFLDHWRNNA